MFGVWIKLATDLEKERIYSFANCLQPAISVVEKNSENIVLVPRFPERMAVKIVESSLYGKIAKISDDGKLVFIFWMDVGIQLDKLVCGIAWTEAVYIQFSQISFVDQEILLISESFWQAHTFEFFPLEVLVFPL